MGNKVSSRTENVGGRTSRRATSAPASASSAVSPGTSGSSGVTSAPASATSAVSAGTSGSSGATSTLAPSAVSPGTSGSSGATSAPAPSAVSPGTSGSSGATSAPALSAVSPGTSGSSGATSAPAPSAVSPGTSGSSGATSAPASAPSAASAGTSGSSGATSATVTSPSGVNSGPIGSNSATLILPFLQPGFQIPYDPCWSFLAGVIHSQGPAAITSFIENAVQGDPLASFEVRLNALLLSRKQAILADKNNKSDWIKNAIFPPGWLFGDHKTFDVKIWRHLIKKLHNDIICDFAFVQALCSFRNKVAHAGPQPLQDADCHALWMELLQIFKNLGYQLKKEAPSVAGGGQSKVVANSLWMRLATVVREHFPRAARQMFHNKMFPGLTDEEFTQALMSSFSVDKEILCLSLSPWEIDLVYPQSSSVNPDNFSITLWKKIVQHFFPLDTWREFQALPTLEDLHAYSSESSSPCSLVDGLFQFRNYIFRCGCKEIDENKFSILWDCLEKLLSGLNYDLARISAYKTQDFDCSCTEKAIATASLISEISEQLSAVVIDSSEDSDDGRRKNTALGSSYAALREEDYSDPWAPGEEDYSDPWAPDLSSDLMALQQRPPIDSSEDSYDEPFAQAGALVALVRSKNTELGSPNVALRRRKNTALGSSYAALLPRSNLPALSPWPTRDLSSDLNPFPPIPPREMTSYIPPLRPSYVPPLRQLPTLDLSSDLMEFPPKPPGDLSVYRGEPEGFIHMMQKGIVVVINNEIFGSQSQPVRNKNALDVFALTRFFKDELGFAVRVTCNLTAIEVEEHAKRVSAENLFSYDVMFFIVLTNGDANGLVGVDGAAVSLDAVLTPFKSKSCPSLADKPKVFIFQACPADHGSSYPKARPLARDARVLRESYLIRDPLERDFLIVHPCAPGYTTPQSEDGGIFLKSMIDVFIEFYDREHLMDMFTRVNYAVARQYVRANLMPPCQDVRLTKRCYFVKNKDSFSLGIF